MSSMHLHSTHTPLLQHLWLDLHLKSDWMSVVEFFGGGTINMFKLLAVYAEELWNYNKGILNSIWLLILLIHIKHKDNKM